MRVLIAALALLLTHSVVVAGGYQEWKFGMTQTQVKAVGDPTRYYIFKNGDVGAGRVPFEDGEALLSFYFADNHMNRVMLIVYGGEDANLARQAWAKAYTHLVRVCGDVESPSAGNGASLLQAALAAYDKDVPALAPGQRHQMGCLCMPAEERVWASVTRSKGNQVMVAVNYGRP
jgi:hypothetical protein